MVNQYSRISNPFSSQNVPELSQNTLISIDTTNTTTSQASETDHSIYDVLVPIGDSAQPLGYVALSHGSDLSSEALTTTGQAFALGGTSS